MADDRFEGGFEPEPMRPPIDRDVLRCSFCGKGYADVETMVCGPTPAVAICHECVELVTEIMRGERGGPDRRSTRPPKSLGRSHLESYRSLRSPAATPEVKCAPGISAANPEQTRSGATRGAVRLLLSGDAGALRGSGQAAACAQKRHRERSLPVCWWDAAADGRAEHGAQLRAGAPVRPPLGGPC